jgi:hypothetical protein
MGSMQRATAATASIATALLLSGVAALWAQSDPVKPREPKRPQLGLKATPGTGIVPVRVSATAELKGGDDDFQEYYCPTIEWSWGDGTISESSNDCEPYEAGKSQIRRRYTVSHAYNLAGAFRITFRLKNKDKVVTSTTTLIRLLGGTY